MSEEARALEDAEREGELNDARAVMATPRGRRMMWRLIGRCQIFQEPGPASADIHNYKSGMRSIGLFLYTELNEAAPDDFRKMEFENTVLAAAMTEHQERVASADQPEDIYR